MPDPRLARRRVLAAPAVAALAALAPPALAAFPERPLRWIVGYAPGGATDLIARLLGQAMASSLGQPVVVENRPGAGSALAAEMVAKGPADGHVVMTADNGTLVYNPVLYRRLPYDPDRDLRPVGLFARLPLLLLVRGDSPVATARAYIDRARDRPGTVDYASAGIGSPLHLAMERAARQAGIRVNHVPYRGTGPALNDLVAGTVGSMVSDYTACAEMLKAGRVRALAVFSDARIAPLPDVPTMAELGLTGLNAFAWQGLVVPRATPDEAVRRLAAALEEAKARPEVRARMDDLGIELPPGDTASFERLWQADKAAWQPLIRDLGIALDG